MNAIVAAVVRTYRLSPQEARILQAVSRGQTSNEVAFDLGISRRTVDYYWRQIFNKLSCRSQLEVMALLLRRATGAADSAEIRRQETEVGCRKCEELDPLFHHLWCCC